MKLLLWPFRNLLFAAGLLYALWVEWRYFGFGSRKKHGM